MKVTRFGAVDSGSTPSSGSPTGPAGGDLGGNYSNPAVTGIQGTPVCVTVPTTGQVLTFDGTQWCPATTSDTLIVEDEGTPLATAAHILNFVGAGVTASGATATKTITIPGYTSPLTTKGDIFGHSTVDARIPVGNDNQILTADSSAALGISWQTPSTVGPQHAHVQNVLYSGDGSTTVFELPAAPVDEFSVSVFVANSRSQDWTLSGGILTTLTFGTAPASGTNNIAVDITAVLV